MKVLLLVPLITLFLGIYYSLFYYTLMYEPPGPVEFPTLRARLGTIIYHSSDANGVYEGAFNDPNAEEHTYCYYPKGSTQYAQKGGEYIIKRVNSFWECNEGWYGSFTAREGWWITEKEKLWLSQDQYLAESTMESNLVMNK